MEPRLLTDDAARRRARWVRDRQWKALERIAQCNPLYICFWDKNKHHTAPEPDDLMVCGLIDGMELGHWITKQHPDWVRIAELSSYPCAYPVYITDQGRAALANRAAYDLEPVFGGLVEPGWQAIPVEVQPADSMGLKYGSEPGENSP